MVNKIQDTIKKLHFRSSDGTYLDYMRGWGRRGIGNGRWERRSKGEGKENRRERTGKGKRRGRIREGIR